MRIMTAAYVLCAALLLTVGVGGSTSAEAGYYRDGYHRGGHYRGYLSRVIRTGYYGGRSYYSRRAYYGGYRTAYYGEPAYRSVGYVDPGYAEPAYVDAGCYDAGYTDAGGYGYGYGYGGCHTGYIPYGWTWYRASSC